MKKNQFTKVVSLSMAAVLALGLTACSTKEDENGTKTTETGTSQESQKSGSKTEDTSDLSGKKLSIGVWGGNDQEAAALNKMISDFEVKTGAKVETKVYTDYNTQIQADFIAGTAPDVFYIDAYMFPFYSNLGVLEPLDPEEMGASSYYENLMSAFTAEDGTIYCIPKDVSTLATYYNKGLLESVGVSPEDIPESLEEYKDFLLDLQKKLDGKYGAGQVAAMTYNQDLSRNIYILEADGDSVSDESGKSQMNQENIVKNMEFLTDLAQSGCIKAPTDLGLGWNGEAFGTGKAAIMEEGNWVYTTLKNDYSEIDFGVKEMPTYKGKQHSMSFTVGWGISAASKEKDLAKEWIKYTTGTEGMQTWCVGAGCLPSRADVAEAMKVESDPVWKVHSDMIDVALPWQKGTTIDIINTAYKNFAPAAFKGSETAKATLEQIDKQANSEINNAQ